MWHFRGILVFCSYMAITCLLSHDAESANNDTIAFLLLGWFLRDIKWFFVPVLVLVLASASCATDSIIDVIWCWCQFNNMTKKAISWSSQPMECNGTTDNVVDIPWCWHQYQWYHITKMWLLHLFLIILIKGMQWCHWQCCLHPMILPSMPMASHNQKVMLHLISIDLT